MHSLITSFVLGYHGCDKTVGDRLVGGRAFRPSTNDYDWLGHGVYFWEANPLRGLDFAQELKSANRGNVKTPSVIGAAVDLGLCLDLTTAAGIAEVEIAHKRLLAVAKTAKVKLPRNNDDRLRRNLDCAVIELLHKIRHDEGQVPFDSVRGVFVEGDPVYPTAGFDRKTHIQICVRNLECIKGVFRVTKAQLDALRAPPKRNKA